MVLGVLLTCFAGGSGLCCSCVCLGWFCRCVWALTNGALLIVGRFLFRELARGGFSVALLSPDQLGAFFLTSSPVADNAHNSRVQYSGVVSYTNYGLHTADFDAPGFLRLQSSSRPRPRLQLLALHPELGLLQRRTAAAHDRVALRMARALRVFFLKTYIRFWVA